MSVVFKLIKIYLLLIVIAVAIGALSSGALNVFFLG